MEENLPWKNSKTKFTSHQWVDKPKETKHDILALVSLFIMLQK